MKYKWLFLFALRFLTVGILLFLLSFDSFLSLLNIFLALRLIVFNLVFILEVFQEQVGHPHHFGSFDAANRTFFVVNHAVLPDKVYFAEDVNISIVFAGKQLGKHGPKVHWIGYDVIVVVAAGLIFVVWLPKKTRFVFGYKLPNYVC